MLKKGFYWCILVAFIGLFGRVYADIPVGNWRTHYCYNQLLQVENTPNETFAVANGKLVSILSNGQTTAHSTLTGLNGFDITQMEWSTTSTCLILAYSDGNIDILDNKGSVFNLPDFKMKSMTADKTVYNMRVYGSTVLLSTGVGLLLIDVDKHEISELYKPLLTATPYTIQEKVYDAAVVDDSLFLATPGGLFAGSSLTNLHDPSLWKSVSFPAMEEPVSVVEFQGSLVVLTGSGTVYVRIANSWSLLQSDPNAMGLKITGGYLCVCATTSGTYYNSAWTPFSIATPTYDVSINEANRLCYVAAGKEGLLKYDPTTQPFLKLAAVELPNGPSSVSAWYGIIHKGIYYATSGGRYGDRYFINGDVMRFDGNVWSELVNPDTTALASGVPFMDVLNIAIDPFDESHFFLTSWGEGLYEFKNNRFYALHNQTNSPLVTLLPGRFCRVDGAVFDSEGNLWVLNSTYGVGEVISDTTIWVKPRQGDWIPMHYATMPSAPTWGSILFTSNQQIWCNSVRGYAYGLFVIDRKDTPWDTSDDETRWFYNLTDYDETITPFVYNCLTEDRSGTIWIGTNEGPFLATSPGNVFDPSYRFTRVKIPRNDGTNGADYLLKGIRITAIAVDGANRKWIGTSENGLYLISSDGLTTIHQFNKDNSPLPSNTIQAVTIHPESGEVFIGTNAGMVSYRADATVGKEHYSSARVFPNPVRPGYSGKITVTGLMEGSQVKITDLNGNLLVSGTSLGGQFVWNGLNRQGTHVASGVYLVFCASMDGSEQQVCKFMVLK